MNIIVFSDEVGIYEKKPNEKTKKAHPFYIRGNLFIDVNDYKIMQEQFIKISKQFNIPTNIEIKWSDLYSLKIKKNKKLEKYKYEVIENYIAELVKMVCGFTKAKVFFTVTCNTINNTYTKYNLIKFHIQESFQRAQMDLDGTEELAFFVIDELNKEDSDRLKITCHELTIEGDCYINYKNVYQGLFIDKSDQSVGLKMIDYICGAFNSYLKKLVFNKENNYLFGNQLYKDYIRNIIRKGDFDVIYGYGIKYVPSNSPVSGRFKKLTF